MNRVLEGGDVALPMSGRREVGRVSKGTISLSPCGKRGAMLSLVGKERREVRRLL